MIPTGLSALALGLLGLTSTGANYFTYIVANLTTLGSVILTGNIYLLNELVSTPAIYLNSQAAVTLQADGDVEFGSGDLAFNATRNTEACTLFGTDYVECYKEDVFTATGGSALVGPTYYDVASVQMPSAASGSLHRVSLDCDNAPRAFVATVGVVSATTSSGFDIFNRRAMGSGMSITASGATQPVMVGRSRYVKVSTAATVGTPGQTIGCKLRVWYHRIYNPS